MREVDASGHTPRQPGTPPRAPGQPAPARPPAPEAIGPGVARAAAQPDAADPNGRTDSAGGAGATPGCPTGETCEPGQAEILLERARRIYATAQTSGAVADPDLITEVDQLLAIARRDGDPGLIGQLRRYTVLMRLVADVGEAGVQAPLEEYEAYAKRNNLHVLVADAHALRAKVALATGREDSAVSDAARALAVFDDLAEQDKQQAPTVLGTVLVDIAVVLMALGVFEIADQIMRRAHKVAEQMRDAHLETVLNCNRIFLLLEWGRRLERLNFPDTARQNFVKASLLAKQTEPVMAKSRFPYDPARPIADQHASLAVAHAYAAPGNQHYARLRALLERTRAPHERIELALSLARCLERDGEYARAVELLTGVVAETSGARMAFPLLRVSLHRELARLTELAESRERTGAVQDYIHQLELELWQMRESRMVTLNTRREHERLAREHGTATAQALQDPLTELPNRRALAERLAQACSDARSFPMAVALIDLDGFKGVNDRYSHGRGDDVLQAIAGTLREVLRGDDLIVRYGGDEFVAVLAGAPLPAAQAALSRAVVAVSRLAEDVTLGVTLSVGVVSMGREETQASALARADAAMYEAKRRGGNTVVADVDATPSGE